MLANILNFNTYSLERLWENWHAHILLLQMQKDTWHMEGNLATSNKIYMHLPFDLEILLLFQKYTGTFQKEIYIKYKCIIYTYSHYETICKNKKLETKEMSTHRGMIG